MSALEKVILKRAELYCQVWATPMSKLAKQYSLSDRGLAKICARMGVPVPMLGYWAKLAAGQEVKPTPLPPLSKGHLAEVEIEVSMASVPAVEVLNDPNQVHPLVAQTRLALSGMKLSAYEDFLVNRDAPHLSIRVTPGTLERALGIMNTLLNTLEARGYTFEITKNSTTVGYVTSVSLGQDKVDISLSERLVWSLERYDPKLACRTKYSPTGDLEFEIDYRGNARTRWKDLKKQKLEDIIGRFIESLALIQDEKKKFREEREARELKAEKERRDKAAHDRLVGGQRKFLNQIEKQASHWERAKLMRSYLSAVEQSIASGEIEVKDQAQIDLWLTTGKDLANQLDPITGGWTEEPPEFSWKESDLYSYNMYSRPAKPEYAPWWFVKKSKGWK